MATPPNKSVQNKNAEVVRKELKEKRRELNAAVAQTVERTRKKPA